LSHGAVSKSAGRPLDPVMPAQGRLGDLAQVQADSHGCPSCPHPGSGPAIIGSANVNVNGLPALRVDDVGVHAVCCGQNMWTATAGSATVFINGKAAHRVGDEQRHCGGTGKLLKGSGDVFVGGSTSAGGGGAAAVVVAMPPPPPPPRMPRPPAPRDLFPPADSWIEIAAADGRGRPLAGARFLFTAADGAIRAGRLDAAGIGRLERLPRGTGKVRFPDHGPEEHAVLDREPAQLTATRRLAVALEPLPGAKGGTVILVDGSGAETRRPAGAKVLFDDFTPGPHEVRIDPARGKPYTLVARRDLGADRVVLDDPPKRPLRGVVATVVYAGDESKPLVKKQLLVDGVAATTDAHGRLSIWLDPERAAPYRIAFGDQPPAADAPTQQVRLERPARTRSKESTAHVLAVRAFKARLPIRIACATEAEAHEWVARNPMHVSVDGEARRCGVFVDGPTQISVEFELPPGTHEVLVSSLPRATATVLPPRRVIYVARSFTVSAR
jgi:uncharacterized Zn-binding protein involved in type VI secretion